MTDPMTDPLTPFAAAERVAPLPATPDGSTRDVWYRYHLAHGLAGYVAFFTALPPSGSASGEPGSRPDLGYLSMIAVASTHTAAILSNEDPWAEIGERLWNLTPELGALNGEPYEWLIERLDQAGINPADIDHRLNPLDFRSALSVANPVG